VASIKINKKGTARINLTRSVVARLFTFAAVLAPDGKLQIPHNEFQFAIANRHDRFPFALLLLLVEKLA
jgi:hypothetical protein